MRTRFKQWNPWVSIHPGKRFTVFTKSQMLGIGSACYFSRWSTPLSIKNGILLKASILTYSQNLPSTQKAQFLGGSVTVVALLRNLPVCWKSSLTPGRSLAAPKYLQYEIVTPITEIQGLSIQATYTGSRL